jgi:hypothetical protein
MVSLIAIGATERDERKILLRTFVMSIAVCGIATVLMLIPVWRITLIPSQASPIIQTMFRRLRWVMVLNWLPDTFLTAAAGGLALGIASGSGPRLSTRSIRNVLTVAVVFSALSFFTGSWIAPVAIYHFRVAALGMRMAKWPAEMTIGELAQSQNMLGYHLRWAFPWATFALATFALSASARARGARLALVIAACGGYYYWVRAGAADAVGRGTFSAFTAAWLPNVVVVIAACALLAVPLKPDTTDMARG